MKRITAAAALLATVLLAVVFSVGTTTADALGPAVPSRTIAPADTSWGGCGTCHPQP
jgi:hypothetical protein